MTKLVKSNRLLCVFALVFILLFISNPTIYMQACLKGLNIWFFNVLPALFPFFVATRLIILLDIDHLPLIDKFVNKLFGVKNGGKIFFLSLLSGYPIGAKLICDAYKNGQIDAISAKKMLSFCSVSGPMFIIGTVGIAVFNSAKVGYILLVCHILSAIINGLIFARETKHNDNKNSISIPQIKSQNILADSMIDSINSILLVGGYIVFAYVLIEALNSINLIPMLAHLMAKLPFLTGKYDIIISILNGCLEMTRGIVDIGILGLNTKTVLPIVSFLLGFGGISVFMQSTTFTRELDIKKPTYLFQKFCQGIWAMIISIIICMFV